MWLIVRAWVLFCQWLGLGKDVARRKLPRHQYQLESLEARQMMTATVIDETQAVFAGAWDTANAGYDGGAQYTSAGDGSAAAPSTSPSRPW
jgi:hypothetical protein